MDAFNGKTLADLNIALQRQEKIDKAMLELAKVWKCHPKDVGQMIQKYVQRLEKSAEILDALER